MPRDDGPPTFSPSQPSLPPAAGLHLLDASMFWGSAGGVRRVITAKHERLALLGWQHTVMAPGARGDGHIDCGGVPLPFTGGYRMLLRRGHAARLIERAQPDIVEAADPYTLAWSVVSATVRLGIPAVAFCHSHLPAVAAMLAGEPRSTWAFNRARDYLLRLYSHFDLVMAPSHGLAAALKSWGVRHASYQPLGVDCSVFTPEAAEPAWRHTLCRRLGLNPRTRLIVYTGRFAPEKRLQLLADAVGRLGDGHALLAVGAGPRPPQGAHVHLLPTERDSRRLAMLVASCDVYAHAGDRETFGLGALEAMACGTPVVASHAGGLGELVNGVGQRVDRADAGDWAGALAAAMDETDGHARRLAALALDKARQHDWPHVLQQLSMRYLRLVGRPAFAPSAPTPLVTGLGAAWQRT